VKSVTVLVVYQRNGYAVDGDWIWIGEGKRSRQVDDIAVSQWGRQCVCQCGFVSVRIVRARRPRTQFSTMFGK